MKRCNWLTIDRERQAKTAFHEAGHAALLWMLGSGQGIRFIDMRGKFGVHGFVYHETLNVAEALRRCSGEAFQVFRLEAKRQIMNDLAGLAVDGRLRGAAEDYWLDELLYEGEWEFIEEHDLARALKRAKAVCGDNGNALRMVRRMARWADEAVSDSRVWSVIEALARRLGTVKRRLAGSTACRIMDDAWGSGSYLPYMTMGRKWRRRFSLP